MISNKDNHKLSIAIPASLVSDVPHLREKSFKIGLIGRAASIFCVDEIIVFPDIPRVSQKHEINLISTILSYLETPQYLRKLLFKLRPELRYAGILPPLRTPHHPLINRIRDLTIGEYREGVVVKSNNSGALVEIGVEKPINVSGFRFPINTRVTVRVIKLGKCPKAALIKRKEIKTYWGYRITVSKYPLARFLRKRHFDLFIATSIRGVPITELMDSLEKLWKKSRTVLVAFGAPTQGLYEILSNEHIKLEDVADFTVNTIPCQGTETVRTEEALYATLAVLNLFTQYSKKLS